jgi:hypothetical protein
MKIWFFKVAEKSIRFENGDPGRFEAIWGDWRCGMPAHLRKICEKRLCFWTYAGMVRKVHNIGVNPGEFRRSGAKKVW